MREFALKLVNKEVISFTLHSLILEEQRVMRELVDLEGWVVTLYGSTHDSNYFYLLMVRVLVRVLYNQYTHIIGLYTTTELGTERNS